MRPRVISFTISWCCLRRLTCEDVVSSLVDLDALDGTDDGVVVEYVVLREPVVAGDIRVVAAHVGVEPV